jgi:hypothetical protein
MADPNSCMRCALVPRASIDIQLYPSFLDNSYQLPNILGETCVPKPGAPCSASANASLLAYRNQMINNITAVTSKPGNGAFIDSCFVHEQNVNYCSNQGMPNCVGWSPLSTGSKKWGYTTAVTIPDGRSLTPQQAFGAYYRGDKAAAAAIDQHTFFDNPTCHYLGKPVPGPAPPPTPPPPNCSNFRGAWSDTAATVSLQVTQTVCAGTYTEKGVTVAFTAQGDTITTAKSDHGGRTGELKPTSTGDAITWSDGDAWERPCASFAGDWIDNPHWFAAVHMAQVGCQGSFTNGDGEGLVTYSVQGTTMTTKNFMGGLTGDLVVGAAEDTIKWSNHAMWERNHTASV